MSPGLNPIRQLWDQLGRACSYPSHHRHHAISPSDCGWCVEFCTTAALSSGSYSVWGGDTRLLLWQLVLPHNANVINVSNEVCGETFRVFNLILLIMTGYRYFKVSLINVILALFSDDPPPYYQPHHSVYKKGTVIILAWMTNRITWLPY